MKLRNDLPSAISRQKSGGIHNAHWNLETKQIPLLSFFLFLFLSFLGETKKQNNLNSWDMTVEDDDCVWFLNSNKAHNCEIMEGNKLDQMSVILR